MMYIFCIICIKMVYIMHTKAAYQPLKRAIYPAVDTRGLLCRKRQEKKWKKIKHKLLFDDARRQGVLLSPQGFVFATKAPH